MVGQRLVYEGYPEASDEYREGNAELSSAAYRTSGSAHARSTMKMIHRQPNENLQTVKHSRPFESRLQSTLAPVQSQGSSIPLYLVHEILGGVACYSALAAALGANQPVYAFRPPFPKHGLSIRDLADIYLRDLLMFQPAGPCILGGYSFGGLVAFEMAQRLRERGGEAALVVMFDTWVPGFYRLKLRERASVFLRNARACGRSYVGRKINDKWEYWKRIVTGDALNFAGSIWDWLGFESSERIWVSQADVANNDALSAYRPLPYEGRVLLLMSSDTAKVLSQRGDPTLGWSNIAGTRLEVRTVASDHSGFLKEPSVQEVAKILLERSALCVTEAG